MDKILSTRVDESIIHQLNMMTDVLSTTKKAVLEKEEDYYLFYILINNSVYQKNCDMTDT